MRLDGTNVRIKSNMSDSAIDHYTKTKMYYYVKMYVVTRAPRGTDRSPEYNEHFC